MKLATLLLPFLLAVTIISPASAAAPTCSDLGDIENESLQTARDSVIEDMISNTYKQRDYPYCTWNTVDGQTMYGYAACAATMTCEAGGTTKCQTTPAECASCLATARDSIHQACGARALGAHFGAFTAQLWCYMRYEADRIAACGNT